MDESENIIKSLYDMYMKNDLKITNNYNKLCEANKQGDYRLFITLAKNSTPEELSICLETAKNFNIVKCILEDHNITNGIVECYKNAVMYDNINIIEYIEEKYTKYIQNIIEIESDIESESVLDNENEDV